ncbi:hypothetical protein [Cohnella yongneupensis]|uniref:Sigma-70 family RNA polymerase sigma factor n=1 Tax=Cohnella yongneupensis TaxID=425006 RepID=A0ABW0R124_9BACL
MKQKRKKQTTPEIEQRFHELYDAVQADIDQINLAKQNQSEAEHRATVEQENVQSWGRQEFETLNTLMAQYKQTNDSNLFNTMWHDHLKKLTDRYLNRFIIKGLPFMARRLFLTGTTVDELQDELYLVLLHAIHDWKPDAKNHRTLNFATYYEKAVEFYSGNLLRKFNSKCHNQLSLQNLNFYSEAEVNLLLLDEPKLAEHFQQQSDVEHVLTEQYIERFVRTRLSKQQAHLFYLLQDKQLSVAEIASTFKIPRMTVYRRREQLQKLWLAYERENCSD